MFERHGIKRMDPIGRKFDPTMHQAMLEIPSADQAPGTVVQVLQAGYRDRRAMPAAGAGGGRQGRRARRRSYTRRDFRIDAVAD